MRAVQYDQFGGSDVLELREVAPPLPQAGRARVHVHAAALNPKDVLLRKGRLGFINRGPMPRGVGYDVAGVLLDDAGSLAAGTEVFGMLGGHRGATCAEVVSLGVDEVARKPRGASFIEAASLPLAGLTALQALRDELRVRPGARVLLNGASGGVGTLAVQITKALGAVPVAVCSARNHPLVQRLGAQEVVDYHQVEIASLRDFDAVFDIYGNLDWAQAKPMLRGRGRYCTTVPTPGSLARGALARLGASRAALVVVTSRRADLDQLRLWWESGALRAVVDQVVALEDTAAGHAHLETRRARGKVVVQVIDGVGSAD